MRERHTLSEHQVRGDIQSAIFAVADSSQPIFVASARNVLARIENKTGQRIILAAQPDLGGPQLTDFRLEFTITEEKEEYQPTIVFNPQAISTSTPAALEDDLVRTLLLASYFPDNGYQHRLYTAHAAAVSGQYIWPHLAGRAFSTQEGVPDRERKILASMTDVPYLADFGIEDVRGVLDEAGYPIYFPTSSFINLRQRHMQEVFNTLLKGLSREGLAELAKTNRDELARLAAVYFLTKLREPEPSKGRYNIHA